jgi:hypothetical protein
MNFDQPPVPGSKDEEKEKNQRPGADKPGVTRIEGTLSIVGSGKGSGTFIDGRKVDSVPGMRITRRESGPNSTTIIRGGDVQVGGTFRITGSDSRTRRPVEPARSSESRPAAKPAPFEGPRVPQAPRAPQPMQAEKAPAAPATPGASAAAFVPNNEGWKEFMAKNKDYAISLGLTPDEIRQPLDAVVQVFRKNPISVQDFEYGREMFRLQVTPTPGSDESPFKVVVTNVETRASLDCSALFAERPGVSDADRVSEGIALMSPPQIIRTFGALQEKVRAKQEPAG